ncbi:adenine deaminase [Latilactobacillus graminis]|uniref:Adenine deaminase n=2 Tax=Latilactobacillus graminis TaxID=60519 RepID=A0AA89IA79_9LACO|nr:adenine deaminase [Latilactobacillus graminis]KRM24555.1 adeC2 protein [Latilactobacillus graminis DSM 20719]QFP78993.1 adenine deaminase [Latilactobacillus graminis]
MDKTTLKQLIDQAAGRQAADMVIKNAKIVDVYNGRIIEGALAIGNGRFLGISNDYLAPEVIDARGQYIVPGLIDPHIHIESANVSPAVFGSLVIPHGTTTILADPHEIVNVAGMRGLEYMIASAKNTALDIQYTMPSCVPAANPTLETSGAVITADDIQQSYDQGLTYGLAEFMNYPGVVNADDGVLNELLVSINAHKLIDGHSPALKAQGLNAYAAAGIRNDHECTQVDELLDRISRGMYVYLRYGTVSKNMPTLLKGVTPQNARFCCLCGDDLQSVTLREIGHLDESIRVAVANGIDPIIAIQMATINTAQCTGLADRGGIAPGLKADFLLVDDLEHFSVNQTFIDGQKVAANGESLLTTEDSVAGFNDLLQTVHLDTFSADQLKLNLTSDKAHVIGLQSISRTQNLVLPVTHNADGDFQYNPDEDIAKVAVIERHHLTGNVGVGLLNGFGIKNGAIATSIGHDSHNLVVVGTNDADMVVAIEALKECQGGGVAVKDGQVIATLPFVIGGLMSDEPIDTLIKHQKAFNAVCHSELNITAHFDPIMKLGAMPLDVIPNLRITDKGLVDVTQFKIIDINA